MAFPAKEDVGVLRATLTVREDSGVTITETIAGVESRVAVTWEELETALSMRAGNLKSASCAQFQSELVAN